MMSGSCVCDAVLWLFSRPWRAQGCVSDNTAPVWWSLGTAWAAGVLGLNQMPPVSGGIPLAPL